MKDKSTDTPVSIDPVGDIEEDRGYRTWRPRRQKERNYGNFVDLDDRHYGPLACPRPEGRLCVSTSATKGGIADTRVKAFGERVLGPGRKGVFET